MEAYSGNYKDPENPDNNFISSVIDKKTGNSLTMCMLYAIISEELGIPLQIVNFQGYFALRYYSRDSHFYIDAYNKGLFFTPQQVERFLQKLGVNENVNQYKPLSNIYTILNLISAIIMLYQRSGETAAAERFIYLNSAIEISMD
jgi:regulator of sirC expression with transglutaminase-like and TPR domain